MRHQDTPGHAWGLVSLNWALMKEDWIGKKFFRENVITDWPSWGESIYYVDAYLCVYGEQGRDREGGTEEERKVQGVDNRRVQLTFQNCFVENVLKVCSDQIEDNGKNS